MMRTDQKLRASGEEEQPRRRASARSKRRAIAAGLITLIVINLPFVVGYALLQQRNWTDLAAMGRTPAPAFYDALPIHWPRMFLLSLFSANVALWVALLTLLPLDESTGSVFEDARRRLRRRWLYTHAPFVPLAALLTATQVFSASLGLTAGGAAWYEPHAWSRFGVGWSSEWLDLEQLLFAVVCGAIALHTVFLAGFLRPLRALVLGGAAIGAAVALSVFATTVVIPFADGGVSRSMRQASAAQQRVVPRDGDAIETSALMFDAFVRTEADSPAFMGSHPAALPPEIAVLPPLPCVDFTGLTVELSTTTSDVANSLSSGDEWRVNAAGRLDVWPLPDQCSGERVLKLDRALRWRDARDVLLSAGAGPARFAFRPAPLSPPRACASLQPTVSLDPVPEGVPRMSLPLEPRSALPPPRMWPGERPARLRPGRQDAFVRDAPTDVLWHQRQPLGQRIDLAGGDGVALVMTDEVAWDDVLRAIATAAESGASRIWLTSWSPNSG